MQIPLDYYRILGLPIQATAEQLQQAHRDRGLQLPRREFSVAAIEARKQLIDKAYRVLSDREHRRDYDSKFLASAYTVDMAPEPRPEGRTTGLVVSADVGEAALRSLATEPGGSDAQSSKIDIEPDQIGGALLILLELGEYEQVLQLGQPQLSNPYASGAVSPEPGQEDVVLSLALACLELGREQWQQHQYEIAAESLQTGHELLARGNYFPAIRAEIQAELYKLRPYRILELLARPLDQTRERRQGLKLLKAMLEDRGGIEGSDDDLSGLAIDDFLRFIQQLRDYLTASEQQELFEHEARRPSPVATYLTVYALLARGFARHQPALVRRAKQLLLRLGGQQDVHLEQAVCALLLGQTEEANRALELSQEYEPLAYIREHSRQSPDLLPGLCLYAERWLKDELFPHFRDFKDQEATLKDYFADTQVQAYLEAMPVQSASDSVRGPQFPLGGAVGGYPGEMAGHHTSGYGAADYGTTDYAINEFPTIEGSLPIGAPTLPNPAAHRPSAPIANGHGSYTDYPTSPPSRNGNGRPGPAARHDRPSDHLPERPLEHPPERLPERPPEPPTKRLTKRPPTPEARRPRRRDRAPAPAPEPDRFDPDAAALDDLSVAERVAQLSPEGKMPAPGAPPVDELPRRPKPRPPAVDTALAPGQALPPSIAPSRDRGQAPRWGRLALVGVAGVAGLALLGFGTMRALGWVAGVLGGPRISGQPLDIRVDAPAFEIPDAPDAQTAIGVNDIANRAISEWLEVKRAALGPDYQSDRLDDILLEPVLTQWRRRAAAAAAESWYWEYEHSVEVESVTPDDPSADQLRAIAVVSESARLFEFGVENTAASYDDTLRMQYDLVRQDGNWFVQGMTKLSDIN